MLGPSTENQSGKGGVPKLTHINRMPSLWEELTLTKCRRYIVAVIGLLIVLSLLVFGCSTYEPPKKTYTIKKNESGTKMFQNQIREHQRRLEEQRHGR